MIPIDCRVMLLASSVCVLSTSIFSSLIRFLLAVVWSFRPSYVGDQTVEACCTISNWPCKNKQSVHKMLHIALQQRCIF